MFRRFLEYVGLANPVPGNEQESSLADDAQRDAEYINIPSATVAATLLPEPLSQAAVSESASVTIKTPEQQRVEDSERAQEMKLVLENELRKKTQQITKSQWIQTAISAEEKRVSSNDPTARRNGYYRLNSEDFINEDRMQDSLNSAETDEREEKEVNIDTIDELIGYYNDVSPEFDRLKEKFQNISLLQSAEQTTILFPTLQQYQPASPALNFRQMNNPTYLSQKSQNLATNFNNYFAFNLPKIKMYRSMIEKNEIDDTTIERAYSAGFECAEQMRRTSYSVSDLLEKAETFNNDMQTVSNATTTTLSGMIKKLEEARHELDHLHTALHDYQIKKQYVMNSTELERKPLLAPAFR